MATEGSVRRFLDPRGSVWEFPRIDDDSPEPDSEPVEHRRAPRLVRWGLGGVVGITAASIVIAAVGVVVSQRGENTVVSTAGPPGAEQPLGAGGEPAELVVYVSGAVHNPGLVTVAPGERIHAVIEQVGGVTGEAELSAINLARPVVDGEHIVIPRRGEAVSNPAGAPPGMVSLSLSSSAELQTLPGVGPALAGRIIEWREKHGAFRHVDDVTAVAGIGPATLERFRHLVTP